MPPSGLACWCQQQPSSHKWHSQYVWRSVWSTAGRVRVRAGQLDPVHRLPQSGCLWGLSSMLLFKSPLSCTLLLPPISGFCEAVSNSSAVLLAYSTFAVFVCAFPCHPHYLCNFLVISQVLLQSDALSKNRATAVVTPTCFTWRTGVTSVVALF